jgi:hypothetical protein
MKNLLKKRGRQTKQQWVSFVLCDNPATRGVKAATKKPLECGSGLQGGNSHYTYGGRIGKAG